METSRRHRRFNPVRLTGLIAAIYIGGLSWSADTHGAGIYKWVDENGRTHYTDSPPNPAANQLDLPQGPDHEAIRSSREQANRLLELDRRKQQIRQRAKAREEREALARRKEERTRQRQCRQARNDLAALNLKVPVYRTNDKGERVYIEDHERPQEIAKLRQIIKRYCPN